MSPRGVPVPDVRQRLFDAAERVLGAAGPDGLTSRAVTTEAGCAKGLLYNHFADLDEFVAELVLDRLRGTAERAEALPGLAGRGTVAGNLTEAACSLLDAHAPAVAGLAMTRAGVSARIRAAMAAGAPGFGTVEVAVVGYLDAEKRLGRVRADLDADSVALAVVGTAHHLLMTSWAGSPDPRDALRRLVVALVGGPG
ncbi:TetR/AcrR family transcriptional regulator [Longispora sp. K20-0274]|uniref:TetR/AcrR family transcriptional regulator n=1 Tax=Longispora sp. K20-0274 TaxID=3088255 RepID=UPI0039995CC7